MSYKLSLKNKATRETLEVSLEEFEYAFRIELNNAIQAFIYDSHNKRFQPWKPPCDKHDFYFDLRYNFNSWTNSNWYIEKIH